MDENASLRMYHPLVRDWFARTYQTPTSVQQLVWPKVREGKHILATAPTGSGKTLAAFLWGISQLVSGGWDKPEQQSPAGSERDREQSGIRILYISPLKALNNDIRLNLLGPLRGIRALFQEQGSEAPEVRVLTRSGDTPQSERQRMLRKPPHILITTPESLNLLLTSARGQTLFGGLRAVILDEIHAVVSGKRGVHLITAVERLTEIAGEFQRIALSATVKPLDEVADFVGGWRLTAGEGGEPVYTKRQVQVLEAAGDKRYDVRVVSPVEHGGSVGRGRPVEQGRPQAGTGMGIRPDQLTMREQWWDGLISTVRGFIENSRSTLVFTNSRRLAEKLTRLINADDRLAYAHHGSLSREIRAEVERRLKKGELRAIIATSSLELGIDVGALDQVILLETPFSCSSSLQRAGRAGHQVGEVSRAVIVPLHPRDFVNAAVMAGLITEKQVEQARIPHCPLDVLAQVILSMTGNRAWPIDDLYNALRTSHTYHDLTRSQFESVLDMLAGRYERTRIRELKPRVLLDRLADTVQARRESLSLVYMSGGTIPDRGYFDLRVAGSGAKIGELDEEFVWERTVGESFVLGTQTWKIISMDQQKVEVTPSRAGTRLTPFWKGEGFGRDSFFSEQVAVFLERVEEAIRSEGAGQVDSTGHARGNGPSRLEQLLSGRGLDQASVGFLADYLDTQREAAGGLPHRHQVVAEHLPDPGKTAGARVILHTLWGDRVNRPFALALSQALADSYGFPVDVVHDDDCVMVSLPEPRTARELLALVTPESVERLIRKRLPLTGFFGARFRENAGRALLLPRLYRRRIPLWHTRVRAKRLMEAVRGFPGFPVTAETWRTCLQDDFDLDRLVILLEELAAEEIRVREVSRQTASPFAAEIVWRQTGAHMYEDDTPYAGAGTLTDAALDQVLGSPALRPRIEPGLVREFEQRLQRTLPGYAPSDAAELTEWVRERVMIPEQELRVLLAGMAAGGADLSSGESLALLGSRIAGVGRGGSVLFYVHLEQLDRAVKVLFAPENGDEPGGRGGSWDDEQLSTIAEWLRFYGPVKKSRLGALLGISGHHLDRLVEQLGGTGEVVVDSITASGEQGARDEEIGPVGGEVESRAEVEVCDRRNLEILIRRARRRRVPDLKPLDLKMLPLFLAAFQGLALRHGRGSGGAGEKDQRNRAGLGAALEPLFGCVSDAAAWEEDILPARVPEYEPDDLDRVMRESDLVWFGWGEKKTGFFFEGEADLFLSRPAEQQQMPDGAMELLKIFPDVRGMYSFDILLEHTGLGPDVLLEKLWSLAWQGLVSCDDYNAVRRMIAKGGGLSGKAASVPVRRSRYAARSGRWRTRVPGNWFVLRQNEMPAVPVGSDQEPDLPEQEIDQEPDLLEVEEMNRDRARQLLQRYGVVFRELLSQETAPLKWSGLVRTFRTMELSGEIVSGQFFTGIQGLQFASHRAVRMLRRELPGDAVFWMNAADPASLCGAGLETAEVISENAGTVQEEGVQRERDSWQCHAVWNLPRRMSGTHLVFHGPELVLVSRRRGEELEFRVGPDHPGLQRYFTLFDHLTGRALRPVHSVKVFTINGAPALLSPYAEPLIEYGFTKGYRELIMRGGYR